MISSEYRSGRDADASKPSRPITDTKEQLEIQKLQIETALLRIKHNTEEEKLQREVEELRQAPRRARRTSGENLTLGTLTTRSKPAETLACSRYHLLRSHH
jgi:hypothetical protein